jgi:hypothetical protein
MRHAWVSWCVHEFEDALSFKTLLTNTMHFHYDAMDRLETIAQEESCGLCHAYSDTSVTVLRTHEQHHNFGQLAR